MEKDQICFDNFELGAIAILVSSEIVRCEEALKEDAFTYRSDRESMKVYLKTLKSVQDKINGKGDKDE